MTPRVAGTVAMVGALAMAVASGFLIGHPPWSIPGAVLLVAASILFCVGALWTLRRSWADKTWPPNVGMDRAKALRRAYRISVMMCFFSPLLVGMAIVGMVEGESALIPIVFIVVGVLNFATSIARLKMYRGVIAAGDPGSPPAPPTASGKR